MPCADVAFDATPVDVVLVVVVEAATWSPAL